MCDSGRQPALVGPPVPVTEPDAGGVSGPACWAQVGNQVSFRRNPVSWLILDYFQFRKEKNYHSLLGTVESVLLKAIGKCFERFCTWFSGAETESLAISPFTQGLFACSLVWILVPVPVSLGSILESENDVGDLAGPRITRGWIFWVENNPGNTVLCQLFIGFLNF